MNTPIEIYQKLKSDSGLLTQVIVMNNPQAVGENLRAAGVTTSPPENWQGIYELVAIAARDFHTSDVQRILDVPFNEAAPNETRNYRAVIDYAFIKQVEKENFVAAANWASLFPESFTDIATTVGGQQSNNMDASQSNQFDEQGNPLAPKAKTFCSLCKEKKSTIENAVIILFFSILLFFIIKKY
jgi:hypothetical protein